MNDMRSHQFIAAKVLLDVTLVFSFPLAAPIMLLGPLVFGVWKSKPMLLPCLEMFVNGWIIGVPPRLKAVGAHVLTFVYHTVRRNVQQAQVGEDALACEETNNSPRMERGDERSVPESLAECAALCHTVPVVRNVLFIVRHRHSVRFVSLNHTFLSDHVPSRALVPSGPYDTPNFETAGT